MKKQNIKYYFLAFLIPFFICLLVSYCKCFIFGGHKNLLVSDMQGQYVSLFSYLQDVFRGNDSIFYSFTKSLGGNMFGTFAYYLASPLNFIIIFFSKAHLTWGILLIVMLKISLSGLTMYFFLNKHFNKDKLLLLMFSTCYSLIAFNVNYYFNVMWLDAVYLLPLLLIGIDRIIKNESSLLYGIILAMAIISNYYTGYMLCLFSCIYFIYSLILNYNFKKEKNKFIRILLKFGITSLLVGLMCSFLLIPTVIDLQNGQRAFGKLTTNNFNINFNIFDIISRTYIASTNYDNILSSTMINLYSGLIIYPLVIFYFLNSNIKRKEKLADGIVLLFFIASVMVPHLNLIWHGFNFPYGFNYRFSFIFSFFLIFIACKSFDYLKKIPLKQYLLFYIGYVWISLITILLRYNYLSIKFVYISVVCIGMYLTLLYYYFRTKEARQHKLIKYLLIIMVCAELFFNFFLSIRTFNVGYQNEFEGYMTTYQSKINQYKANENDFYRMEKPNNYTHNDSMLLGYKGLTTFLSTTNEKIVSFLNNLGISTMLTSVNYHNTSTELIDSILGVKYYYSPYNDKTNYRLVDSFKFFKYAGLLHDMELRDINIYENLNALSLGYMISDNSKKFIERFVSEKKYTNFDYQNLILKTMVNSDDDYFKPYNITSVDKINYQVEITNNQNFYVIVPLIEIGNKFTNVDIYINDIFKKSYTIKDFGVFLVENTYGEQTINLSIYVYDSETRLGFPAVYYLDNEKLTEAINELKQNQLIIEKQKNNYIKGSIEATKDKSVLFTSIPYENGWIVKVDGKKVDYYDVYETFIGLDLTEGTHTIEFIFYPPGFKLGVLISLITLILFVIFIWKENKILKLLVDVYIKYEEIINYLIVGGLTTLVNFVIYFIGTKLIGINYIISSVLAWIGAIIFAYVANKIFVFKKKNNTSKELYYEIYQFLKYRIASLGIDIGLMYMMVDIFKINDMISKIIVQVVIIIVNYVFSKLFVFKKTSK